MANIAFFHNALGKTDGVSLEVDKWRDVLRKMGHKVFYCAGNDDVSGVHCIPELSFMHPDSERILRNATSKLQDYSENELEEAIYTQAKVIKMQLLTFIEKNNIEVLIPNNLLSVGYHLPALIALSEVIEESKLPTIAHNHDFYFEDSGEVNPTCHAAWKILDRYSPPSFSNVQNIVINRLAQKALLEKKGISARVVPNVFDFTQAPWEVDAYNTDFRKDMGINPNDIIFLQATRVMERKGIELAIDLTATVNKIIAEIHNQTLYNGKKFTSDCKIVLICAGRIEQFGTRQDYKDSLEQKARSCGVSLMFVGDYVKHSRTTKNSRKVYSLWDTYVQADFVTYPSFWEGWGNQLIEAIFAKLPVAIFEYPVFTSDLKSVGLDLVSLGDTLAAKDELGLVTVPQEKLLDAAKQVVTLLIDKNVRSKMVENNLRIGRNNYSYEVLAKIIRELLHNAGY